jgi:hypothetical protein
MRSIIAILPAVLCWLLAHHGHRTISEISPQTAVEQTSGTRGAPFGPALGERGFHDRGVEIPGVKLL